VCRNEEEATKDAAVRAELIAGLERKLAQGDKALIANKGFRRFVKTTGGRPLRDRSRQDRSRRPLRWDLRIAHQH